MQVLSVLLKLRQVCCHPKLFLPDYEGTSGKLELLVQTVQQATQSKRRMLVFSQFVGMLQIIRKRLSREGVKTLYLDGSTPPETRQALCDRFNGGEGQVFLISLKAGGTGLNLTGADLADARMVRTRLWGATLTGAKINGANLSNTNIMRAKFTKADLSKATLKGAFGSATYGGATFLDTICPSGKKVTSPASC